MKKTTHLDEAQALEEYKALYSFYNLYPIKQGYREDSGFSSFWKETLEQNSILQNIDNSMIQDGVFCFSTDSASRRYYIDTHSGTSGDTELFEKRSNINGFWLSDNKISCL